jgi:hypothetical protein
MVRNDSLVELLQEDNSLISGKIIKIEIKSEKFLSISITLELMYSKQFKWAQLKFVNVEEYLFYYSKEHIFYNIERYKFFRCLDGRFYISLDPADENEEISEEDQDFILSLEVEGLLYS